jgi:RNA polymerase sigma factor (sigma-70 family)
MSTTPQELFDRNQRWAEGIARSCLRHLPPSFDGDDLKQAALIALWKCSNKFDSSYGVPFQGYAQTYVQKACWMLIRRRSYLDSTMEELPDTMEAPAAKRPDSQVIRHESADETYRQMQALPAAHRKVIEGLYYQSQSLIRLAQQMRTSAGSIAKLRDEAIEFIRSESKRKLRRAELRRKVAGIR